MYFQFKMGIFSLCKGSWPSRVSRVLSAKAGLCNRASQPKITSNTRIDLNIFWLRHGLMKAEGTFPDLSFSELDIEQYAVVLLLNVLPQGA